MSVPYGTPPQAPQQSASQGPDLKLILTLVPAGVGLVGYVLGFIDDQTSVSLSGMSGFGFIVAAALSAMRLLPQAPNTLYAAAPLSLFAALGLLQGIVGGTSGGVVVVLLLLAIVQAASLVGTLLLEAGIVELPKPKPAQPPVNSQFGQPPHTGQFGQPRSGPFPQQPGPQQPGPQSHPQAPGPRPATQPPPQQQPGGWNPPSGGMTGNPQSGGAPAPSGPPPEQPKQGTQKLPHPGSGTPPRGF